MAAKRLTLRNVMTRKVDTISPNDPISSILSMLKKRTGLPVVNEQNQILGIVTEYDLLKIEKNPNNLKLKVRDVMNPSPFILPDTASFKDAENLFIEHHKVNPIPVLDKNNRVVGVVSRSDILRPLSVRFWIKKGIFTYFNFLRRSLFSHPDDIERPYHKIANVILKTFGICFFLAGIGLNWMAAQKYLNEYRPLAQSSYSESFLFEIDPKIENQKDDIFKDVIFLMLLGISCIFIFAGISPVLLMRYIAFTLPDRIYLRAFATSAERNLKREGWRK